MRPSRCSLLHAGNLIPLLIFVGLCALACGPSQPELTGNARVYADAKDMFSRGNFDRTLEFTDNLAFANPANEYTERARVLEIAVLAGMVEGYKSLADAYGDGSQHSKDAHVVAEDRRSQQDNMEYWGKRALQLGQTVEAITKGGAIGKELTLEARYPTVEGPISVSELERVRQGGSLEPDQQQAASVAALRKGVDDALARLVGGDRSKARNALAAGSVKINGADFSLFLAQELVTAADAYDRKHLDEPSKLKALMDVAQQPLNIAAGMLKDSPNPDREAALKRLEGELKAATKSR